MPGYDLWRTLNEVRSIKGCKVNSTDYSRVSLKFENNRLKVGLIENGQVVDSILLKAKVENNFLSIKRKYVLIPILPMFYLYYNYKIVMGNAKDGNLILKMDYDHQAAMLVMASGDSGIIAAEYAKASKE
jgi:hypothetical protein